eukprot:3402858-Alexandrium_andersonii.AAC.1
MTDAGLWSMSVPPRGLFGPDRGAALRGGAGVLLTFGRACVHLGSRAPRAKECTDCGLADCGLLPAMMAIS